jgi:hypothetical protein
VHECLADEPRNVQRPVKWIQVLTGAFRAGSWLALALACLNAGILLFDGLVHSERLSSQHLVITVVVALAFAASGAAIFGLHWSLERIRKHSTGGGDRSGRAEPAVPWMVARLVLGLMLALTIVLMASASTAMIGRLRQGFTIFG